MMSMSMPYWRAIFCFVLYVPMYSLAYLSKLINKFVTILELGFNDSNSCTTIWGLLYIFFYVQW